MKSVFKLAVMAAAAAVSFAAAAAPIGDLYSTGVGLNDGDPDTHYKLFLLSAGGPGVSPITSVAPSFPASEYNLYGGPIAGSKWVVIPRPFDIDRSVNAVYVFRTTFTIGAGFDPATASITGSWKADNFGDRIVLNGNVNLSDGASFQSGVTTPFSIVSGFVAGLNTLDFYVTNTAISSGDNPVALDAAVSGTVFGASTTPVPEPGSLVLVAMALLAGGLAASRKRT